MWEKNLQKPVSFKTCAQARRNVNYGDNRNQTRLLNELELTTMLEGAFSSQLGEDHPIIILEHHAQSNIWSYDHTSVMLL